MAAVNEREARVRSRLIAGIDRVDLRVRDIDRSLDFYRDVVGLEVADRGENNCALNSPEGPTIIGLNSRGVAGPADRRATGLFHVAIRFPTRAALGDVLARLGAAGAKVGAGDHAVSEALYVDDPDGNGIELYADRPVNLWPAPTGDMIVPMVTLPVDLESVLNDGGREKAIGAVAALGTDVGHVHLQVADIDRTTRFYSEALGLDLIARMGAYAAFFSSNGYHHHIGANTWNSRNGAPASHDRAGLDRIVFRVPDPDELERARLRLEDHGHTTEGTGELTVSDPDGVELHFRS
jgi:catechol 2,3-dioxygenase